MKAEIMEAVYNEVRSSLPIKNARACMSSRLTLTRNLM